MIILEKIPEDFIVDDRNIAVPPIDGDINQFQCSSDTESVSEEVSNNISIKKLLLLFLNQFLLPLVIYQTKPQLMSHWCYQHRAKYVVTTISLSYLLQIRLILILLINIFIHSKLISMVMMISYHIGGLLVYLI